MKRVLNWQVFFALILIMLSVVFYCIHYWIFRDIHHIFLYLVGDIAFLFLDVLIVVLVLHRLLGCREKQLMLKKLNMVIGAFFVELGTDLIKKCSTFDPGLTHLAKELSITKDWSNKEFDKARKKIQAYQANVNSANGNLEELKTLLVGKRQFLLGLLENPNLLEHECFTNLLWAVFHLTDELQHRDDLRKMSISDYQHISVDINRAYQQLIIQWLEYIKHLKRDYPYLFSFAIRTNPFDRNASVNIG